MTGFRCCPFLLFLLLFVFSNVLEFSHGISELHNFPIKHVKGIEHGEGHIVWGERRNLGEELVAEGLQNSSILAAEKTHRKDPSDNFNYYTGGWNITNEHYLYSVGYTAFPLLLAAAIWFVVFAFLLLILCLRRCCCCHHKHHGYSRIAYALSLIFIVLLTIATVLGSALLYTSEGHFHTNLTNIAEYIVKQAATTIEKLTDVWNTLAASKGVGINQNFVPPDVQQQIDEIGTLINSIGRNPELQTEKASHYIHQYLEPLKKFLNITALAMLFVSFLGFLFSICSLQFLVYILIIIGWILVTVTFVLGGIFLLLHNAVADTCIAMDQWVKNPTAHTALDQILPCLDNATAQATLHATKEVTLVMVTLVNQFVGNVSNIDFPPNAAPLYYNQSGPLVPFVCSPFNPDLSNRNCSHGEVHLKNIEQQYSKRVCQVLENGVCTTEGRLTPTIYKQMVTAAKLGDVLYRYGPFLVSLVDCTFVRETFSDIRDDYCPGLRRYSWSIYVGLVMISTAVMFSLIFWIFYARQRRHRVYSKKTFHEIGKPLNHYG